MGEPRWSRQCGAIANPGLVGFVRIGQKRGIGHQALAGHIGEHLVRHVKAEIFGDSLLPGPSENVVRRPAYSVDAS